MTLTGTKVGHYRVEQQLGKGSMGEVYLGFNEALKKEVALKALRARRRLSARARARFLREARILSQLDHPNICRIHDYVEGDDADFLVLELIDGSSLRGAIDESLDKATKLRIAEQIAHVLVEAHKAGVVHRDLKPGNVMLTGERQVKVLDFGLARPVEPAPGEETRGVDPIAEDVAGREAETIRVDENGDTRTGTVDRVEMSPELETAAGSLVGTPAYMSPEQARGEPAISASDMYSFGLLLQTLFTGRPPYDEDIDMLKLLERAMRAETRPVTGLDADLTRLIERLKSPAPASRPTAVEAAGRLRRIRDKPRRRMRRLSIGAAVLALALFGMKYTLDLRYERGVARQRQAQAEGLLEYMGDDLREKLAPLGQLDILDDVGDKTLEYFESVDADLLSVDELSRYAKVMSQIGEVRMDQGNLEAALEAFRESLSRATSLAARDPLNGAWQKDLGAAHFWVGVVHWRRGDVDGALEEFRTYKSISEALVAREPESDEWQLELAYGHTNIGNVHEARGDLEGAIAEYRAALEIKETLAGRDPDDADRQHSLTVTHEDIGGLLENVGRLAEAEEHFRRSVSIKRALVEREPRNTNRLANLGVGLHMLGDLLEAKGDVDGALEQFREDLEIGERLAARDPSNTRWKRGVAISRSKIGELLIPTDFERAMQHLHGARESMTEIIDQDPTNAGWQRDLATVHHNMGLAFEEQGDLDRARRFARDAVDDLEVLCEKHPGDRRAGHWLSRAYLLEGRLLEQQARKEEALAAWSRALEIIEPLARGSAETAYLEIWAKALLRLEKVREAEAIVQKLRAMGHKSEELSELCQDKGCTG
jgi:tetratricopeptide (TPR) repeat protein/tRNA A-37 threonylcarbamoyl transferase component Bud32